MPLALNFWVCFWTKNEKLSVAGFGRCLWELLLTAFYSGAWTLLCFLLPLSCSPFSDRAEGLSRAPGNSCCLEDLLISAFQGPEPWPDEHQRQDAVHFGFFFLAPQLSVWLDVFRAGYCRHINFLFFFFIDKGFDCASSNSAAQLSVF